MVRGSTVHSQLHRCLSREAWWPSSHFAVSKNQRALPPKRSSPRPRAARIPVPSRSRRRRTTAAEAARAGDANGRAAVASLAGLPPDALDVVGQQLVVQDKLNSPLTAARDIASLALTSRGLRQLAKDSLWPLLGQQYTSEGDTASNKIAVVPRDEQWEREHLSDIRLRKLEQYPKPKELAQDYEQDVEDSGVPPHIYSECRRLRCLGIAASNAKAAYQLTDTDLRGLEHEDRSRGSLGTMHLYSLSDILSVARGKHGSVEGIEAAAAAKANKAQEAKSKKADKVEARRAGLAAALAQQGITLNNTMCQIQRVAALVKGGKAAPALEELLPMLRLVDWAQKHTSYNSMRYNVLHSESRWMGFKVMFRDEMQGGGYYGGDYFSAATKAAATLSEMEEEDLIRLACQKWAKRYGGIEAAMARPEVPQWGPLRDAIAAAMTGQIRSGVDFDAGYYGEEEEEEEGEGEEGGQQQQVQQQQQEQQQKQLEQQQKQLEQEGLGDTDGSDLD